MLKVFKTILSLVVFIALFGKSFAIEAPEKPILVQTWENFIEISWSEIGNAVWYYVSYWKNSITDWPYERELPDLFENQQARIYWLNPGTFYYVAIKSIDENWNESEYSQEWSFKTLEQSWGWEFWINEVKVSASDTLELVFNRELEDSPDAIRDFKINKENDEFNELSIMEINLKEEENLPKNTLEIKLEEDLIESTNYVVVAIEVRDKDWNIIQSWVNWEKIFTTPTIFPEDDLNSAVSIENTDNNVIVDGNPINTTNDNNTNNQNNTNNSNPVNNTTNTNQTNNQNNTPSNNTDTNNSSENNPSSNNNQESWEENPDDLYSKWWVDTYETDDNMSLNSASKSADELPTTWPREIIVVFIALIIWLFVFLVRSRKRV